MNYLRIVFGMWLLIGLYWLVASRSSKKDISHQSALHQLYASGGLFAGFYLLFSDMPPGLALAARMYAPGNITGVAGCLFTGLGFLLAIWARRTLGRNWSRVVALKEQHELVTSGPYRLVRHPIYSALLLMALGTGIVIGKLRCVLGLALILSSILYRVTAEETLMLATFPDAYPPYQEHTWRLFPWIF